LERFNTEEISLIEKLETKKTEIAEKKISSFQTRKELHFFFSKYYDE
jgi:hypothetical protein